MKELEGDITGAANIMQELQVETYGSMNKREKVITFLIIFYYCDPLNLLTRGHNR